MCIQGKELQHRKTYLSSLTAYLSSGLSVWWENTPERMQLIQALTDCQRGVPVPYHKRKYRKKWCKVKCNKFTKSQQYAEVKEIQLKRLKMKSNPVYENENLSQCKATGDVCRQEAKYCLALGSFIFIRSIKAYIYQDSKQLPLLTTSTLFSHSLRCIRAKRRGEAAFNAIYTWRHNSIKRSCFVKETGNDMIILAGAGSLFVLPPMFPLCNPDPARRFPDMKSMCEHFFVQTYPLQREKGFLLKQLPL